MNERTRVWLPEISVVSSPSEVVTSLTMPTMRMEGHFHLQLINAKTKVVERELSFPNVLTNGFLDAIGNGTTVLALFNYLAVGTGAVTGVNTPSGSDTSLAAEVTLASTNRTNNSEGTNDNTYGATFVAGSMPYWKMARHRLFTETQGNGNLTELGFFSAVTAGTMANRAAIRDGTGTPITLTKTAEQQLRVEFEWRLYVPVGLVSGTFFMGGSNIEYTSSVIDITSLATWGAGDNFPGYVTQLGNWVGTGGQPHFAAHPSGTMIAVSGTAASIGNAPYVAASANWLAPYVAGTYVRQFSSSFDPGVANWGNGVGAFGIHGGGQSSAGSANWYIVFNPGMPKNNTQRLRFSMQVGWGRSTTTE